VQLPPSLSLFFLRTLRRNSTILIEIIRNTVADSKQNAYKIRLGSLLLSFIIFAQPPYHGTSINNIMLTSPKVFNYPIPGNPTGGILHIYGEPSAAQDVILYCGGFPDGLEPISELAERLATTRDGQDRGCYVGVTCFPGFDNKTFNEQKFTGFKKSGFTFDEVTCCVRDAADLLFKEHAKSVSSSTDECKTTFTLMAHDWGAIIGHLFINRAIEERSFTQHKPDRLVMLDVLLFPHPKSNYKEKLRGREIYKPTTRDNLLALSYRAAFAMSFAALQYISEAVGLIVMAVLTTIVFSILKLDPLQDIDNEQWIHNSYAKDLKHCLYMMYPYYHMFKDMSKGSATFLDGKTLPLDLKETPVLYMYGAKKNVMFHNHRSIALLEREEKEGLSESRVVRLEESGHWMYIQEPEVCESEIRKFLKCGGGEASSGDTQSRLS
jgi:pimeloyl-ACP methyl ester carboxylesterase